MLTQHKQLPPAPASITDCILKLCTQTHLSFLNLLSSGCSVTETGKVTKAPSIHQTSELLQNKRARLLELFQQLTHMPAPRRMWGELQFKGFPQRGSCSLLAFSGLSLILDRTGWHMAAHIVPPSNGGFCSSELLSEKYLSPSRPKITKLEESAVLCAYNWNFEMTC